MLVATVLEDINVKVTPVLKGVFAEVTSTCEVAVVIVATAPEVADVKVAVFPKVVVMIGRLHWLIRSLGQPVVELWYSLLPVKSSYHDYDFGEGCYFNVDHRERCECYYNNGNAGGVDFNNDTFKDRCYYNVDHCERCKCYYNDGNAGGIDFSNDTFENRCYINVDIFEDRDFILSNYTCCSWFLVRVPENRCFVTSSLKRRVPIVSRASFVTTSLSSTPSWIGSVMSTTL